MEQLPFDTILVADEPPPLSVAEFFAIPLTQRVRLIMEKRLRFFDGEASVELALGLRGLMNAARRATTA